MKIEGIQAISATPPGFLGLNNKLLHIINLVIQKWMLVCKWSLVLFHFSIISRNYVYPTVSSFRRERATEGSDSSQQYKWKTFETLWPRIARNWLELSRLGKGHKKGQGNQFLWTICILPGLCPYLCGKLYCNIPLSSMFKIYDANIIYFHFCIAPTTTAALNRPGSSLWKKPTFFYGTLQFTHEHLVVKICCSKEMLFLFVLSRKNLFFFVSNANCQGEFLE